MFCRAFTIVVFAILFCACAKPQASSKSPLVENKPILSEIELDNVLQNVASSTLGDREGAVLVIDPQTGRLRAVVNPRMAFEQAYPPGSAVKPFTALAALRAGLLDLETRRQCQTKYVRGDFEIV